MLKIMQWCGRVEHETGFAALIADQLQRAVDMLAGLRMEANNVGTGFGGQSFIPEALKKVAAVRTLIDASGHDILLEVDGGVKVENIAEVAKAGADTFVAGSAIFGKPDYKTVIDAMRAQLASV